LDPATTTATVVSSAGLLLRPKANAVALDGSIYIADGGASTFSGLVIRIGAGGSQAALSSGGQPTGLAVDAFGNIEVSRTGEHKIESFSPDGTLLQSTPTPGFDASVIAATSGGLVYAFGLSTGGSTDGYKFDPESQSVSHFFGPLSDRIAGAAVEPNGDIAYVETGGLYPTVLSMHPDGTFSWIENRYYLHRFHNPLGVAVYGVRNGSVPARPTSWGRLKGIYRR
jgi:DNA-binding beta-propeller fold protein YncE